MTAAAPKVVDVHAHVFPWAIMGQAGPYGPEFRAHEDGTFVLQAGPAVLRGTTVEHSSAAGGASAAAAEAWIERMADPALRLAEMDAKGIDVMGVSPGPPLYLYWAEPEVGVPFARAYNDALAAYCTADPSRLFFLAALPLQDVAAAAEEVTRAVRELGARGFYTGASDLAGRELDDQDLWPLFAAIEGEGVPLCIHPSPARFESGEPDRYREKLALGFPEQETKAVVRLIAGGVLDAFPALQVVVSHGGGYFPYQLGRIDAFLSIASDSRSTRGVEDYLPNLHFDVLLHDASARRLLVEVVGDDHVLLGSNYAGMDSADGLAFVDEIGLGADAAARIRGGNACRLFGLDPGPTPAPPGPGVTR